MNWLKQIGINIFSFAGSLVFFVSFVLFKYSSFCKFFNSDCFNFLRFNITYFVLFVPIFFFSFFIKNNNFWFNLSLIYLFLSILIISNTSLLSSGFLSMTNFAISLISVCLYTLISLGILVYGFFKKN